MDSVNPATFKTQPVSLTIPRNMTRRFIWLATHQQMADSAGDWKIVGRLVFDDQETEVLSIPIKAGKFANAGSEVWWRADSGGGVQPPLLLGNFYGTVLVPCFQLILRATRARLKFDYTNCAGSMRVLMGMQVLSQCE
jgi:hypothetical protein